METIADRWILAYHVNWHPCSTLNHPGRPVLVICLSWGGIKGWLDLSG